MIDIYKFRPISNLFFSLSCVAIVRHSSMCCSGFPDDLKTVQDFKSLVLSGMFVDKSLLINEILQREEKVFQITQPRKWGKTVNLEMLRYFFEIEFDQKGESLSEEKKVNPLLFKGRQKNENSYMNPLKISNIDDAMNHMGRHPVIFLNLKNIKGNSVAEFEGKFKRTIVTLFLSYPFLGTYLENGSRILDDDEKDRLSNFLRGTLDGEYVFDCLEFLSMVLYEHFHSYICLFIDDYDFPIINAFLQFGDRGKEFEYVVEMFHMFYDYTFKQNQYLLKAVITGTLNFNIVPSGISEFEFRYILYNNVFNGSFSSFYGFSQNETDDLLVRSAIQYKPLDIKNWYGGIFVYGKEIFNPLSVMKFALNGGKLDYYLLNSDKTSLVEFFNKAFFKENLLEYFHWLLEGKPIIRNVLDVIISVRNVANDFVGVFAHAGYLNLLPPEREIVQQPIWRMRIPNLEVKGILASGFKLWAAKELGISNSDFDSFTNLLITQEIDRFGDRFRQLFSQLAKFNGSKVEEHCYHNLMIGITSSLGVGYLVDSIKEFGQNRGESLIVPLKGYGNCAINIEYNVCKPWQKVEDFVKASLSDLLHRPRTCSSKVRALSHVIDVLYIAVGLSGKNIILKHKKVRIR